MTADKVLGHIENYAKSIGAGVIYISHDKNVLNRCDRVIRVENKVNTFPKPEVA